MRKMLTTIIAAGLIGFGCSTGKEQVPVMEGFSKAGMRIGQDSVWVQYRNYNSEKEDFLRTPVLCVKGNEGVTQYVLRTETTGSHRNKDGAVFLFNSPYNAFSMSGPQTKNRWIKLDVATPENRAYLMERYGISLEVEKQKAKAYLDSLGNHSTVSVLE